MSSQTFQLLDLPAELRNRVYDYYLEDCLPKQIDLFNTPSTAPNSAITAVCRQLRTETLELHRQAVAEFWQKHTFGVLVDSTFSNESYYYDWLNVNCQRPPQAVALRDLEVLLVSAQPGLIERLGFRVNVDIDFQVAKCICRGVAKPDATGGQQHALRILAQHLPRQVMHRIGKPLSNNTWSIPAFGTKEIRALLIAIWRIEFGRW